MLLLKELLFVTVDERDRDKINRKLILKNNDYSKTSCSLWDYYRDELTDERNDNNVLQYYKYYRKYLQCS